jgi:hypothetical protein
MDAIASPQTTAGESPVRQLDTLESAPSGAPATELQAPETRKPTISPQLAAMAKRERMLVRRDQELKAREEALKAREVEYKSSYVPKDLIKKDPLKVFEETGLTTEELTQALLNQPSPQDRLIRDLQAKLEQLESRQTETLTSMQDQEKQKYEQAVGMIRSDVNTLVSSDPDFETIKATGSEEAVVDLIQETFSQEGRIMSVEEAAKEIEDYLVEEALKIAQLKKIQGRLAPTPSPAQDLAAALTEKNIPQATGAQKVTLTHAQAATSKPLSARERALMAFRGELK